MPENAANLEPFADIDLDEMSVKLIDYLRKELDSTSVEYLKPLTRLTGGYETFICRFQLSGVDERLSKPLIIRVYAENTGIELCHHSPVHKPVHDGQYSGVWILGCGGGSIWQ